jgi:hypothetical protein
MLTGNQVIARVKGPRIFPGRVKPGSAMVEAAEALIALYAAAAADHWRRAELEEAVANEVASRSRPRVLQGMAKLLADRSTFEVHSPMPPGELRARVFALSAEMGPLAFEAGPFERTTADDVLTRIGEELNMPPDAVREALYADLKQNHRVIAANTRDPTWLLNRYDVAQVQALLLRAVSLEVTLTKPTAPRMRQLFRQVKFHQLLHRAERGGKVLKIVLDGPTSLFKQSTRYGLALANFFPALLLQPGPWSMEATVLWTKAGHRKQLCLDHTDGLTSHYKDRGGYKTEESTWFAERFKALKSPWKLTEGKKPIQLGDKSVLFPDYTVERSGRVAHIEILGFWRHDALKQRIEMLQRYGDGNIVLAVSRKLRGSKEALENAPDWVLDFANVVPAARVRDLVEDIALPR